MRTRRLLVMVAVSGAAVGCVASAAVATSLQGSVMASGGLLGATNGSHTVSSITGQPVVGTVLGVSHRGRLGFWCQGDRVVSVDPAGEVRRHIALGPAFPNPSRDAVRFVVALPVAAKLRLEVFDVSGRRVGEPVERAFGAGYHSLGWEAPVGRAGVYFARVFAGSRMIGQRRIVLIE